MLLLLALSTTIVRPTLEFTSPIDRLQRLRGGNTNATRNGKTVFWFLWLLRTALVLARVAIKLCTHEPIEDDFFHHIFHQCVPELVVFMFVYDFVFPAIKYLYRVSVSR